MAKLFDNFFHSKAAHITYAISTILFILHLLLHAVPVGLGGWAIWSYVGHGHTHGNGTHNHKDK